MKIFSNFDTELKKNDYQKAVAQYGKQNVLLLSRSSIFRLFFVALPAVWWTALFGSFAFVVFYRQTTGLDSLTASICYRAIGILYVLAEVYPIKNYIDYTMDYTIVTPDEVSFHNQSGIFSSNQIVLNAVVIKSVNFEQKGFIKSVFNFGDINFVGEGEQRGAVNLYYIHNPEFIFKEIDAILDVGDEHHSIR